MLITLMLAFALIAIGLLAILPEIGQQIKRDREEELRHRGTAYMRAIQHYYKKLGRYPTRVEELENTNNIRFLRKRYKDPLTHDPQTGKEQDFKFLHQQDISLNSGIVLPGQMPGQTGIPGQAGFGGPGSGGPGFGGQAGANAAIAGAMAAQAGMQQAAGTAGSPFSSLNNSSDPSSGSGPNQGSSGSNGQASADGSKSPFNGTTFGGGPILGVASTSKEKSIRVFADKNHYKDWMFVYVPMADRGGLLVGPMQPGMPTGGNLNGAAGMPQGASGQTSGFGQSSFGQSSFGQSSNGQSSFGQPAGFGQGQGQPLNQSNPTPQSNTAPPDQ